MEKTIALIAHDGKKNTMVRFARQFRDAMADLRLIATVTTGEQVVQLTELPGERMLGGSVRMTGMRPILNPTLTGVNFQCPVRLNGLSG